MMEKVTNFNSEVMYNDSQMSTRNEICKDRTLNVLENLILAMQERKTFFILHFFQSIIKFFWLPQAPILGNNSYQLQLQQQLQLRQGSF